MASSLQPPSPLEANRNEVDLPVIDISQFPREIELQSSHDLQFHPEIAKLREACKEWGFFGLMNHGIPPDVLQKVHSVSRDLVSMPMEVKDRVTTSIPIESYIRTDSIETFCFLDIPNPDSIQEISRKIWPEQGNSNFCDAIGTFSIFVTDLAPKITKLILASLGLDVGKFYHSDFEKCKAWLRINGYSSHGKSLGEEALPSHADPSCVTILYTHDVEGLEIRSKDGKWFKVKLAPDSLVVNLGDSFKAWSNGRYRSADHRVVCTGWKDRISVPLFHAFPKETQIWAPEELVEEDNPRRYKPFLYSELLNELRNNRADKEKVKVMERLAGI